MKKTILIKTKILICSIIIVGFTIISCLSYYFDRELFKQNVEQIANLTEEGIFHEIDAIFAKPIYIVLTMANDNLLKQFLSEEGKKKEKSDFIEKMRKYLFTYKELYHYDSVFLASAKTNYYYHFDRGFDHVLKKEHPNDVWYFSFLNSSEEYSVSIEKDESAREENEIKVFIYCKIKDSDDNILGVAGVSFPVDYIQKIFADYEKKSDVKAYFINKYGTIEISTKQTACNGKNLFEKEGFGDLKEEVLSEKETPTVSWYFHPLTKGYMIAQYISSLDWYLVIDYNTSILEAQINQQYFSGFVVILIVIAAILFLTTKIIHDYNTKIVKLTVEKANKHRSIFQMETAKIYENIYEIDITHNCAASEETETYFRSLGVPENTPYNEAIQIIAKRQIKEEFQQGYLDKVCPENILSSYEKGIDNLCYDFMITNDEGGTYYWIRITVRIFYWEEDKSVRIFGYRQNIDEEKCLKVKMLERMERDSLTGLYNKVATQEHIKEFLKTKEESQFGFFMFDIDNFKAINDTYGHGTGDLAISKFADILKSQFSLDDIVGRIGGDEFVVFIPIPSKEWAEKKAKILSMILHYEFIDGENKCKVSVSIGIAVTNKAETSFETLYKNADNALYQTKENGKNGYTIYHA